MNDLNRKQIIDAVIADLSLEIIKLRRTIHQNPELSFAEYQTADLIYQELVQIDSLKVTKPTDTSVLAVLKGPRPGKTIAVRCDLDALSLQEENDISYKSQHDGIMHACGHDGHAAMLVGAAKAFVKIQDSIRGEIRFIFQHAEEKHPGGAKDLVQLGVLQGVDNILALHLWTALPLGKIGLSAGPLMAAPDNIDITISGKGGHAGMPHEAVDSILVSAHVITALQSIVSRQVNPIHPVVLTISNIQGGSAYNVIPEKVTMKGTVRTFDQDIRKRIPGMMESIIQGVCAAYDSNYEFNYEKGYDPVVNDSTMVNIIQDQLTYVMGKESLEKINPVMGGEDFSEYLKVIPGVLLFIGAGNIQKGIIHPHHHPCFNIDEGALDVGMKVLIWSVLSILHHHSNHRES